MVAAICRARREWLCECEMVTIFPSHSYAVIRNNLPIFAKDEIGVRRQGGSLKVESSQTELDRYSISVAAVADFDFGQASATGTRISNNWAKCSPGSG